MIVHDFHCTYLHKLKVGGLRFRRGGVLSNSIVNIIITWDAVKKNLPVTLAIF